MIHSRPVTASSHRLLLFAAAALLHAFSSHGATVAPNTPFDPGVPVTPGTTIIATGSLAGTVLADQTVPFAESMGPWFTGSLRSLVVQRTDTSTFDFYYQIANTTPSEQFPNDADIYALALDNFGGYGFANDDLEMIFRTDGLAGLSNAGAFVNGTVGVNSANREPQAPNSAGFVFATDPGNFFDDPANLGKDEVSNFLVIRTNSTTWANSNAYVTGTFGTASTQGYAPVPEPSAAALAALGALGLGMRRRRVAR